MAEQLTLRLSELQLPDEPEAWQRLGFVVDGDVVEVGGLSLHLDPAGPTPGWTFTRTGSAGRQPSPVDQSTDGIPTTVVDSPSDVPGHVGPVQHPNGIVGVDHVVVTTPDGPRTAEALAVLGLELRRRRPTTMAGVEMEQWFYRPGTIVEVVAPAEPAGEGPAAIWGVTFVAADLDTTVASLGPLVSPPRPAVQPGRRIASMRRQTGLGTRVAVMDAHVPRDGAAVLPS